MHFTHTHARTHKQIRMHALMCTGTRALNTHTYIHTHDDDSLLLCLGQWLPATATPRIHTCRHTHAHTHTHTYTHAHTHIHTHDDDSLLLCLGRWLPATATPRFSQSWIQCVWRKPCASEQVCVCVCACACVGFKL